MKREYPQTVEVVCSRKVKSVMAAPTLNLGDGVLTKRDIIVVVGLCGA